MEVGPAEHRPEVMGEEVLGPFRRGEGRVGVHVDPVGYPQLAEDAGLRVTDLQVEDVDWDFGSRAAFADWCTVGFADWTARLTNEQIPVWVDEVVTDYQQLVGRPGLFRFMQLRAELTPTGSGVQDQATRT